MGVDLVSTQRYLGKLLAACSLLAASLLVFQADSVSGHTGGPSNEWTCAKGHATYDGECYRHLSYKSVNYTFTGSWTSSEKSAVNSGTWAWSGGAPSIGFTEWASGGQGSILKTTNPAACIACVSLPSGSGHLNWFNMQYSALVSWNTSTSSSHGGFGKSLRDVATHEWGHVVGLGESSISAGNHACGTSFDNSIRTMGQDASCIAAPNKHTERTSLHGDDWTGRCQIYNHAHGYSC